MGTLHSSWFQLKPIAWRKSVPICVLGEVHKNWDELNNALWSPAHLTTEDIKRLRTIGFSRLPIRGVVWWTHIIVLERFPSLPTFARNFSWEHSLPSTPLWTPLRASWWCWFLQISRKRIKFHVGGGRGTRTLSDQCYYCWRCLHRPGSQQLTLQQKHKQF